jgi:hypothetical protein
MKSESIEWINLPSRTEIPQKKSIYKTLPHKPCNPGNSGFTMDSVNLNNHRSEKPKWTIMHYGAADNDLKPYLLGDMIEMERVGSTKNSMEIVSLLDLGKNNCKVYHIQQDFDSNKLNSPVIKDMGETNTADPKTLAEFITFSMQKFPAENYAVIIGDHGGGWKGAIIDETSKDYMTLPEIREAFQIAQARTGEKVDVIGFDACLMATGEVAYELRNAADYLVGSQEIEGSEGWNYTPILDKNSGIYKSLKPYPHLLDPDAIDKLDRASAMGLDVSPEQLARGIVANAQNSSSSISTLSALDLNKMDKYRFATNNFANAIIETDTPKFILAGIARQTQRFKSVTLRDQADFCKRIFTSERINDIRLKNSAHELYNLLVNEIIIEKSDPETHPGAYGMSVKVPDMRGIADGYKETKFARETQWDEAMDKILKNPLISKNTGTSASQMTDFDKYVVGMT